MTQNYSYRRSFLVFCLCALGALLVFFYEVLEPSQVLFANDAPLGYWNQASGQLPGAFTGVWRDLNTVGSNAGTYLPNLTGLSVWLLGPLGTAKFFAPLALFFQGLCAWFLFRQLGLAPLACVLGGVAATLNPPFFGVACWGLASQVICFGLIFAALGLLQTRSRWPWVPLALAGLAVGLAVTEGFDLGAIFSLFVAGFAFYSALVREGPLVQRVLRGFGTVALVAALAGFIAAQALNVLVATSIKGVAGTQQDAETKAGRWDFATQWSLPKAEALGFFIPGLFGYRMDAPEGANYWGRTGRDPAWDRYFANGKQGPQPAGFIRYGGGAPYAGVLVVLVSLWAALQAFRKKDSAFSLSDRRLLWFWIGVVVLCLVLAFGRFAPFYRLFYALPFASTIRNPTKFLHPLSFAMVVLFAYGIHGLCRQYLERSAPVPGRSNVNAAKTGRLAASATSADGRGPAWFRQLGRFDRRWVLGCLAAVGVSLAGWGLYALNRETLEQYLQEVQFGPDMAHAIAGFSLGQVGFFVLLLAGAVGLMILVVSGVLSGPRAKWGVMLLSLFVVIDFGQFNKHWIIFWDYQQKYASNPIIDLLRQKPYEHRVAVLPRFFSDPRFLQMMGVPQEPARQLAGTEQYFAQGVYGVEWSQHLFLYYNIQSLDIIQMPRVPEDLAAFESALSPRVNADLPRLVPRRWQLTNTRYLLGAASLLEPLNQVFDPVQRRFRFLERFDIGPKPGITQPLKYDEVTAVPGTNGPFALIEFTGALPRAKLYAHWQVATNDQAALDGLAGPSFDPEQTLFVAAGAPPSTSPPSTNQSAGTVEFASYAPKDIVLKAGVVAPAVLLLNDKFDPDWKVAVDGKAETLLRCNFLMRGVYLKPGTHTVEFQFRPRMGTFYVSLAAIVLGFGFLGLLLAIKEPAPPTKAPEKVPQKDAKLTRA